MKPELFGEKLYNPRDIEGNPNTKTIEELRSLENNLKNNPAFIGLVPRGSKIKGYSAKSSDVDVLILFDSSKIDKERDKNDFLAEYSFKGFQFFFLDINLERLLPELQSDPKSKEADSAAEKISALTELVVGPEVEHYRDAVRQSFSRLSGDARQAIKNSVINLLMEREEYSSKKIEKRTNEKPGKESMVKKRKLWEARFEKFWGI